MGRTVHEATASAAARIPARDNMRLILMILGF